MSLFIIEVKNVLDYSTFLFIAFKNSWIKKLYIRIRIIRHLKDLLERCRIKRFSILYTEKIGIFKGSSKGTDQCEVSN